MARAPATHAVSAHDAAAGRTAGMFEGALGSLLPVQADDGAVAYTLGVGTQQLPLAALLGKVVAITWLGGVLCAGCGNESEVSLGGGYCRRCFLTLPQCDRCFRSPDHCHHHLGTCRDADWGTRVCMAPHVVYLAETSSLKVGITRPARITTRWMEQGALQARPWLHARTRRIAGELEARARAAVSDRTNWRRMLRHAAPDLDLARVVAECDDRFAEAIADVRAQFGDDALVPAGAAESWHARYPLPGLGAPSLQALRLATRGAQVQGRVLGAKARYLVLEGGVFNTASHEGLLVRLQLDAAPAAGGQGDLFG